MFVTTLSRVEPLSEKRDSNPRPRPWQGRALPTELFSHIVKRQPLSDLSTFRAKNGTRTRDPDLGKVVLYQLSYFRIFYYLPISIGKLFRFCVCKVISRSSFFQIYRHFFSDYFNDMMNSLRNAASAKAPLYSMVTVVLSCFSTPRIFMHM